MIKTLIIIYIIIGIITFLGLMIMFGYAWKKDDEMYGYEYPEEAGNGLLAACFFFIISFLAALLWPGLPLILAGVWIVGKMSEIFTDNWKSEEEEEEE